ncbi:MAG: hypothetical protein KDI43_16810 [Gammaproteobacteria bacterium]|nr:hypothetical protein [Gammaproteobacteria bacterium]MCP5442334.1 hypothetical protein [Chromatiaceae bacterium]
MENRRYRHRTCFMLIFLTLVLFGCSIKTEGLIPDQPIETARQFDKTVKVMEVEGGHASKFGREAYITNEQYRDALFQTLMDAKIFSGVAKSGNADWNLHSEIITITTEAGVSPTYAIVVQYWLVDPQTGEEIWRKGINTRHHVNWNEAFAGGTRIIMAVEGATKKNLTQLVQELSIADLH